MTQKLASDIMDRLGLGLHPIGFHYSKTKPEGALDFKHDHGCIATLITACAKGATVAVGPETCGLPCAKYFLGYADKIFDGVERFLSSGPCSDMEPHLQPERFVRTSDQAARYLASVRFRAPDDHWAVFRPLGTFGADEPPQLVIFLAPPDALGALVYLLHFDAPETERVVAGFASACGSMVTMPWRSLQQGAPRAFWGFHDPSARAHIAADLSTLSMPFDLLQSAWSHAPESFLVTDTWSRLRARAKSAATAQ